MNDTKTISFEGVRGVGKTTILNDFVLALSNNGKKVGINRIVRNEIPITLTSKTAERINQEWRKLFTLKDGKFGPTDTTLAEKLATSKFHHDIINNLLRQDAYNQAIDRFDIFIFDRSIDTTIVYDACDIIMSNPDKYSTLASRIELLRSMWNIALSVCNFPQYTIYLSTEHPEDTLERSKNSKLGTEREYEKDQFQSQSQIIAAEIYEVSFYIRAALFTESRIYNINIDNKTADEIFSLLTEIFKFL